MPELIITSDGSHTIYVPELNEHYHSIHGAVQESLHIFIENGFKYCRGEGDTISIFEVGFGTGLNALLTAVESLKCDQSVTYTSIEKYPVSEDIVKSLNHPDFVGDAGQCIYGLIHSSEWNKPIEICKNFILNKIKGDFITEPITGSYDLIYFDAFGPEKQPEMWTELMFKKIAAITGKDGIFVTYSVKGEVKRNLRSCGFEISLLPGPPGKRQIIRGIKI